MEKRSRNKYGTIHIRVWNENKRNTGKVLVKVIFWVSRDGTRVGKYKNGH